MNTVVVYVLIMFTVEHHSPIVIDNISSRQNCEILGQGMTMPYYCRAVRKVR